MFASDAGRLNRVKQMVTEEYEKLFEKLRVYGYLHSEFRVKLSVVNKMTGQIAECEASVIIPQAISCETEGQLTGDIRGHHVAVTNDGSRHFRTIIDGKAYPNLDTDVVERQLGLKIKRKLSGAQLGYPSETLGRTVWRHLADHYNLLDKSVQYKETPN